MPDYAIEPSFHDFVIPAGARALPVESIPHVFTAWNLPEREVPRRNRRGTSSHLYSQAVVTAM
jgi:hypothetical protein